MRRIYLTASACYIVLIVVICRTVIFSGNADWVQIKSHSPAYINHPFKIVVTLLKPEDGTKLSVDLHWMNSDKITRGYLTGVKPANITADKPVYEFSIPVTKSEAAGYIFPVIYITRDGSWNSRIAAASCDPVPVTGIVDKSTPQTLQVNKARDIAARTVRSGDESTLLRLITAMIFFSITAIFILKYTGLKVRLVTVSAVISGIWEALNASTLSGNALRKIALLTGIYGGRREPQQLLTIAVVILLATVAIYIVLKLRNAGEVTSLFCLSIYWGVSFMQLISLHDIDIVLSKTIFGIVQTGQLIRFAASLVFLFITIYPSASHNIENTNISRK